MIVAVVVLALAELDPLAPLAEASRPADAIVAERLVRRGEPVTLRIQEGSLAIATPARALSDGRKGERVRVVVLATRRTLEAFVDGAGQVRLALP